jgi:holin-like protein
MSSAPAAGVRRPVGVTVIVVLLWIQGLFGIVGGLILFFERNNADVIREVNASSGTIGATGIIVVIVGIATLLVAVLLAQGSNFARWLVAIISVVDLATAVYYFFALSSVVRDNAIIQALIAIIVLYFLFGERGSREFFERHERRA